MLFFGRILKVFDLFAKRIIIIHFMCVKYAAHLPSKHLLFITQIYIEYVQLLFLVEMANKVKKVY